MRTAAADRPSHQPSRAMPPRCCCFPLSSTPHPPTCPPPLLCPWPAHFLRPCRFTPAPQNFPTISRRESLLDAYEYVMHGLVYKYQPEPVSKDGGVKVSVYVSYGGLLMKLTGDPAKLNVLEVDSKVYLLMRKV